MLFKELLLTARTLNVNHINSESENDVRDIRIMVIRLFFSLRLEKLNLLFDSLEQIVVFNVCLKTLA